ncbi:MAG TPA: RodZ domain-containing protein [Croceibacterium sp.]|nr:RodZ domain-containing protein [Croceibacterium sp.]
MADDEIEANITNAAGIGAQLRAAREAQGLTIAQVAAETRIPQRHLQTIEEGDFAALPARTYAIGFSRSYARLLGLDAEGVAETVRAELDSQEPRPRSRPASFEPGDPARVPSRTLGWVSAVAGVIVLLGVFFAARTFFAPAAELPSLIEPAADAAATGAPASGATATPAAAPSGPVVFTALEDGIWVKFYDGSGMQLMQKLMAKGETYTVPADAQGPQLWTGRPDALSISVGGQQLPRLAETNFVMKDVPVSAEALLERSRAATAASTASPTT